MEDKKHRYDYHFWELDDFAESVESYDNSDYLKSNFCPEDYLTMDEIGKKLTDLTKFIRSLNLKIIPYSKQEDIPSSMIDLITNSIENTIFELYVNKEEYLSAEFDRFIDLFQYYLSKIRKINIEISKNANKSSIKYKFKSNDIRNEDFTKELQGFKDFLHVIELDTENARKLFKLKDDLSSRVLSDILRDWRRLKIDIQISSERKLLDFKEYVMNKMLETTTIVSESKQFAVNSFPENPFEQISQPLNIINANSLTILQNNDIRDLQLFNDVQRVITGKHVDYSENDLELILYFQKFEQNLAIQYQKILEELKDKNTPKPQKEILKTKLKSFLFKYAEKIGEKGLDKLLAYLTQLVVNNV